MAIHRYKLPHFLVIELFRYLLRFRRCKRKSLEVGVCRRGWVSLSANFRWKGASPTNHSQCLKSRMIALSCGINISALHCLVLSQSTRVTDRRTERQNYDSQDRTSITASSGKNVFVDTIGQSNMTLHHICNKKPYYLKP